MTHDAPPPIAYRPDIDGLRAVAVLLVIGFHVYPKVVPGGFIGVDIFFVISGYLISSLILEGLHAGTFSLTDFYARRIRRIFPALLLMMAASLVFGYSYLLEDELHLLARHIAGGAAFVSNFVFFGEAGYFDRSAEVKPMLHLWSLAIEEQFYLLWPALLLLLQRKAVGVFKVLAGIALLSFALSVVLTQARPAAAFYLPFARFWELMLGAGLAWAAIHRPELLVRHGTARSAAGVALLVLAVALIDRSRSNPGWWALLPTWGAFLLISGGPGAWPNRLVLSNRWMVQIGLISYPLYLWHWPLLAFARIMKLDRLTYWEGAAVIFMSTVLAWLTFVFVEKPLRAGRYAGRKALGLLGAMAVMLVLSLGVSIAHAGPPVDAGGGTKDYDWVTDYRWDQCFMYATEAASSKFKETCYKPGPAGGSRPVVVLWGDSHAASLYRGLVSQASASAYDIVQLNISGCPPVMGFAVPQRPWCEGMNTGVMQWIKDNRPSAVVMGAYWSAYDGTDDTGEVWPVLDLRKFEQTVEQLRSYGVKDLTLFGHLPIFNAEQPKVAARVFVKNSVDRTRVGFNPKGEEWDKRMRALAARMNLRFISPHELLCNAEGCLISTSRQELSPLAWDYGHLTRKGSELLFALAAQRKLFVLPATGTK